MEKYGIIYADPPWVFRNYSDEWHENHPESKWVGKQYSLMSQEDLKSLPVENLGDKDSALFLWATMPKLPAAIELMEAWGYKYKTVAFTWIKKNIKADSLFTGMGFWTRSNAELCLLGTRGHPKRISRSVKQIIVSKRREHSRKPDEARERIVELMGDIPRIELFAREKVGGWDAWGDEIESDINMGVKC